MCEGLGLRGRTGVRRRRFRYRASGRARDILAFMACGARGIEKDFDRRSPASVSV